MGVCGGGGGERERIPKDKDAWFNIDEIVMNSFLKCYEVMPT